MTIVVRVISWFKEGVSYKTPRQTHNDRHILCPHSKYDMFRTFHMRSDAMKSPNPNQLSTLLTALIKSLLIPFMMFFFSLFQSRTPQPLPSFNSANVLIPPLEI